MKLDVCVMFLLLICSLRGLDCSLPDFTPTTPGLQDDTLLSSHVISSNRKRKSFSRLPGLCGRLRRRRVTVLCNLQKFCWTGRSQKAGQVCRCPRQSRCSHVFIHSL